MKHTKIMSLLSLMVMVSLQASLDEVINRSGIEWVEETTPNHVFSVKEEIKKLHGKTIEPSIDIKYQKNKLNSGINRIVTTIEPINEHEYKIITKTWTDKNGSYLTWENALLGVAILGYIGIGIAGAYAYNESRISDQIGLAKTLESLVKLEESLESQKESQKVLKNFTVEQLERVHRSL